MKSTSEYNYLLSERKKISKTVKFVYWPRSTPDFVDKKINLSGKIMDFGANKNSLVFEKVLRDKGQYLGFDVNKESIKWLKKNNYWVEFWKTKERFDVVVAHHVYEHLSVEERERFIKRSYELLKEGGLFYLEYPHFFNLGGLQFWLDHTHTVPPALEDEAMLIRLYGFKSAKIYLAGFSVWPPWAFLRFVANILIGYTPLVDVVIFAQK